MVRTQVQLTDKQADALKRLSAQEGVSMAEVIRRALDKVIESEYLPDREEMKRRAIAAAGSVHTNVRDLSTKHDDYLAEAYSE